MLTMQRMDLLIEDLAKAKELIGRMKEFIAKVHPQLWTSEQEEAKKFIAEAEEALK